MENVQHEPEKEYSFKEDLGHERIEKVIISDHHLIEGKLNSAINEDLSVNDRRALFNEVKQEILHHMMAEEYSFYPAIADIEGVKAGQLRESKQEHHQVRVLLDEMDDIAVEDPDWRAKLKVLKEDLEHHHREEEEELLSRTKEAWNDKKSEEISANFLKAKKQANL